MNRALSQHELILLAAVFLTVTGNVSFFSNVMDTYPLSVGTVGFTVSLALFLAGLLVLIMTLFSIVVPVRIVVSVLMALAAPVGYVSSQFGTVIDVSMIQNIVETNASEAHDLLNAGFLWRIVLLGIIPVIGVWKLSIQPITHIHRLRNSVLISSGTFAVMLMCLISFGAHYASFFREHKSLRYYANPVFAVYSIGRYFAESPSDSGTETIAPVLPEAVVSPTDGHRELIIMVVGETARADRFSLNGYERITNPYLAKESRVVSFTNVSACGTSTAISVPCIFVAEGHDNFDRNAVRHAENVLDILSRAGVSVLWRDNNSGSKGVAERVRYESFTTSDTNPVCDPECRDVGLLYGLQDYVDSQDGDVLIVLHQMGSHGPAYFNRYPPRFEQFKPACRSADLGDCSQSEINNAYDNSILYTDYFLSQVIAFLKENTPRFEAAMLYVSDHGESLGEKGMYLHGLPYFIAPETQTKVPLIVWVGQTSDIDLVSVESLHNRAITHDWIFNSLLLAFEVTDRLQQLPTALFALHEDDD